MCETIGYNFSVIRSIDRCDALEKLVSASSGGVFHSQTAITHECYFRKRDSIPIGTGLPVVFIGRFSNFTRVVRAKTKNIALPITPSCSGCGGLSRRVYLSWRCAGASEPSCFALCSYGNNARPVGQQANIHKMIRAYRQPI